MTATASTSLRAVTLSVFVRAILHYFDRMVGTPAETDTPYLLEGPSEMMDYTAVIGISGDLQGSIHYTAPTAMLNRLLSYVYEPQPNDMLRCDMAGEVANTLSGNARRELGPGFMISVPVVIQGKPERIVRPKNTACFVIPIRWCKTRSLLMVCLADAPPVVEE